MKPSISGRLPINGLNLHHEVYGDLRDSARTPLLLIPGGFMSTESMVPWIRGFAAERPVITFDQQGHGRTPDTSRPMSYPQFADDAAALLDALGVDRVAVLGYSQGGGVALQLAVRHPGLVEKLVVLSATYRQDGWHPAVLEGIAGLNAAAFAGTAVERDFFEHTPDPAAFDAYLEKMKVLGINDQHLTDDEVRSFPAKTMIIIGDADSVTPEHALAMFRLRGGGGDEAAGAGALRESPAARLVIMPAMSHVGLAAESAALLPLLNAFLDDVPPTTPELF
ncbi:alpha/beta fold hydrolase [Microlunatus sp. GCM10028923]|uniref:alpha/beta fold hydrolase n=1 Tax=Microlunatus sp. GCM10028923 TaxID=3273400 RepID=UPI0036171FA9